jgi:hypothetical protein
LAARASISSLKPFVSLRLCGEEIDARTAAFI